MKSIDEVLNNYNDYKTTFEDRFGRRFAQFLTEEQAKQIGIELTDEAKKNGIVWKQPKEWTEENILKQLKKDIEFGWEKVCKKRQFSSSLMFEVVIAWCDILESYLQYCGVDDIKSFFKLVDEEYEWGITKK